MKKILIVIVSFMALAVTLSSVKTWAENQATPAGGLDAKALENIVNDPNKLLANSKQITFVGPRSGEGYFSQDGQKMIFQSEREPGNPFYQMFILDLKTGRTNRVSTGQGKTTCGWIHPNLKKVMWSSTHLDKKTAEKVKAEYEERAKPVKGRYSWSFDQEFDIFESDLNGKHIKRLTKEKGYDAEGSYSPDGKYIAFASNRSGYTDKLSDEDQKIFDRDPSFAMEIYIMKADGTNVKRLTNSAGYDGGPFFSADGKKITWRRFNADGSKAEIYTMNVDGSDQKQITHLGSMSWAPFYHPSGDYIIFASSVLGYSNFELFIVDSEGKQKPARVTFADGFDGLASFSPDGHKMTWSHRNEKGDSQIYIADWNDHEARRLLNLPAVDSGFDFKLSENILQDDAKNIVSYLASENMQGRNTGSPEEKIYTKKISDLFKSWGLKPALGKDFIQTFEFVSNVSAAEKNSMELKGRLQKKLVRSQDYQVLSYSKIGPVTEMPIVFAGYGIKAAATDKLPAFDSYKDLDVAGKWVMVLEDMPHLANKEVQHQLATYSRPQHKITVAKNLKAAGVIFISDVGLKEVRFEGRLSDTTLPVIKISEKLATEMFKKTDQAKQFLSYGKLKESFETSKATQGFALTSMYLGGEIDLKYEKSIGHNVIARLDPAGVNKKTKGLIIGAHGDHLGRGESTGSSLAKAEEKGKIHFGADDNASGVAGVLELAHYFSAKKNLKTLKKPLYFAVWTGEEIGILGSTAFVKQWELDNKSKLNTKIEASLNMDMIGRLRDSLQVLGVGSAKQWTGLSEEVGLITGQNLVLTSDPYNPTDGMTFYMADMPSISFFTGSHAEYHSPRDTADTLNYPGLIKVIDVVKTYIEKLATVQVQQVQYEKVEGNAGQKLEGRSFRVYLGTIPDYSQEGVKGVRISGVSKNSPAEKAGLKAGDVIIEFDETKIENLYDYVYTLQAVKANKATKIKINRSEKTLDQEITPVLKE
ncbi:MAG: M28 family peptidase [Bdellovibrio sp.]|nr:M28 family peptidase [Bdellovibrio sp.]